MFELDKSNMSNLLLIIVLFEVIDDIVAHLDQDAFISKSLKVLNRSIVEDLESFEKLLIKLVDKINDTWKDLSITN
jgi:hypothetical protein